MGRNVFSKDEDELNFDDSKNASYTFFLDSTIPGSFFSSKGAHDGRPLNWNMLSLSKSNYWNGLTETKIGLFELLPAIKKMIEWYKKTNRYSRHKISQQAQALKSNF